MATKEAGTTGNLLTGLELINGGDSPFKKVILEEVIKDGKPGVVFVRRLSTRQGLGVSGKKGESLNNAMVNAVANNTVTEDGVKLFSEIDAARLQEMSISVFNVLVSAISGSDKEEKEAKVEGND